MLAPLCGVSRWTAALFQYGILALVGQRQQREWWRPSVVVAQAGTHSLGGESSGLAVRWQRHIVGFRKNIHHRILDSARDAEPRWTRPTITRDVCDISTVLVWTSKMFANPFRVCWIRLKGLCRWTRNYVNWGSRKQGARSAGLFRESQWNMRPWITLFRWRLFSDIRLS